MAGGGHRSVFLVIAGLAVATVVFGFILQAGLWPAEERNSAMSSEKAGIDTMPAVEQEAAAQHAGPRKVALFEPPPGPPAYWELTHVLQSSVLDRNQVLAYYGNPYTAEMGVLGAHDFETVLHLLAEHARLYDDLNGSAGMVPAAHLVYAVAKTRPTKNGLHLQYVAQQDLERYVQLTRERGMLLILDVQIGRSSAEVEVEKLIPYLRLPHVHLALDPEWAARPGETPGMQVGSLDAEDINGVQARLQGLVVQDRLPPKILIVHQFADSMITRSEYIERYSGVDLVIDMDGIGPPDIKALRYSDFAAREYAHHAGVKLFFDRDPDLMSEETVLSLRPPPSVVIYQ